MRTHDTNAHDHAHINAPLTTWSPQSAFVDPRDEEEERRKVSRDVKVPTFGDLLAAKQRQESSEVGMTQPPDVHSIRKPLVTEDKAERRTALTPLLASMSSLKEPDAADSVHILKECMQHLQRQQSFIESCIARERALTDTILSHMAARPQTKPTTSRKRRLARQRKHVHHSLCQASQRPLSYTTSQSSWRTTWSLIASILLLFIAVIIATLLCVSIKSQKTCIERLVELNANRNQAALP